METIDIGSLNEDDSVSFNKRLNTFDENRNNVLNQFNKIDNN